MSDEVQFAAASAEAHIRINSDDRKFQRLLAAARKLHALKFFDDVTLGADAEDRRAMGAMRKALSAFDAPADASAPNVLVT